MKFLRKLVVIASTLIASAASASEACKDSLSEIVATSPYIASNMIAVESVNPNQLTFRHRDDARMIANFEGRVSDSRAGYSRSRYVQALKDNADHYASAIKGQGRWAESAAFPYEPIGWRTVEETAISSVGDALVGHIEIRFSPDCTVVSDFVAPSSLSLRSRWSDMASAIGELRTTAVSHVVAETWEPEDTNPVGIPAIAGGFIAPLAAMVVAYMMLASLMRFDEPNVGVRTIIGGIAAASAAALIVQSSAFQEGFEALKYVDNLLLYTFTGVISAAGCILGYRAASFALVAAAVSGVAIIVSALFGWTPSPVLNGSMGGFLLLLGVGGVFLWSMVENGAFRNVRRR